MGQRTIEWKLGKLFIPRVIGNIGLSPEVNFCKQKVDPGQVRNIFHQVRSCKELGESLSNKNILYFWAYDNYQLFHYEEETIIYTAIMRDIRKYEQLLQGPLTYEQFLTNRKILTFK